MPSGINSNYTVIPDDAEVWIALKSTVSNIAALIPSAPTADLAGLGWSYIGVVDDEKGIPLNPSSDVKKYSGFGHRNFRVKIKNGDLDSSFTALELNNPTVKKIALPGSAANKIGMPKDVQIYLLYRVVDQDFAGGAGDFVWVTLTPASVQIKSHSGFIEGAKSWIEFTVYHTADAAGDVFQTVDGSVDDVVKTFTIGGGVTAYTATVTAVTTPSITAKTAQALQTALQALSSVQALPAPGATVEGPSGGPLVATFTGPVTGVSASGTGGTVTVS
jgi:hypothetical protein